MLSQKASFCLLVRKLGSTVDSLFINTLKKQKLTLIQFLFKKLTKYISFRKTYCNAAKIVIESFSPQVLDVSEAR
jgi:hypothetical protein